MIVSVTLNPSLDRTMAVPRLAPGSVHRGQVLRQDQGGKGINVSRALQALGIDSKVIGFFGGRTGQALEKGLHDAGFEVDCVKVDGDTRQNVTLLDRSRSQYTKINEPGPTVGWRQVAQMIGLVERSVRSGDLCVLSGSLPPGSPPDLYGTLIQRVQAQGGRAFLDSSGLSR